LNNYKDRYKTQIQMNITSMMDIVFLLLIMFIIAAPLMRAEVDVKLPKSSAAIVKDESAITITITKESIIYIGNTEVSIEAFPQEIGKMAGTGRVSSVSLKGDEGVDYGIVMRVIGHIKDAGIENLGLVANPEKKRK